MEPRDLGLQDVDVRAAVRVYNDSIVDRLGESDQLGAVLLAPRTYSVKDDPEFHLLGFQLFKTNERYGLNLPRSVVSLVHVDRNEVHAARAIKRNEQASDDPGEPTDYEASSVNQFSLDLRERFPELEWPAGRYLATVHILDQSTNRAAFNVSLGPEYDRDPAVAEFLARQRTQRLPRAIAPSAVAPEGARPAAAYRPAERTPQPPAAPGVVLAVDERVVVDPAPAWVLRGAFRAVPAACEVVPTGPALAAAQAEGWPGVGDPAAVAVLGVTLVLVGNVEVGPYVVRLDVPSHDAAGLASPERAVTGQFAVDLRAVPGMPRRPQTYTIRAFCGEAMSAPVDVGVVTEAMLRR